VRRFGCAYGWLEADDQGSHVIAADDRDRRDGETDGTAEETRQIPCSTGPTTSPLRRIDVASDLGSFAMEIGTRSNISFGGTTPNLIVLEYVFECIASDRRIVVTSVRRPVGLMPTVTHPQVVTRAVLARWREAIVEEENPIGEGWVGLLILVE
jgi:hypothetical protein